MSSSELLGDLASREVAGRVYLRQKTTQRVQNTARSWWFAGLGVAVGWIVWTTGIGRLEMINRGGWSQLRRFWIAAVHPDLSADALSIAGRAALTTLSFAILGTALAVAFGLVGGVIISETWWRRGRKDIRPQWYVVRVLASLPRGVHETVFALLLVNVLGRDPLVGIIALALPFGAVTAKVYGELIDSTARGPYEALRSSGTSRVVALAYAIFPLTGQDIVSYGFYRLECAIRSAVILGMIGAGGLGFELALQFQALRYQQMWTLIYALVLVSAVADMWGSAVRRSGRVRATRWSVAAATGLIVAAAIGLRPDVGRLFSASTRSLVADLARNVWPLRAPRDGWGGLVTRAMDTLTMSLLAIVISSILAFGVAFVAARRPGREGKIRWLTGALSRALLLVVRSIPVPVWALLVLFVVFPGPVPGAVALGIYNFGVLGRLWAEVVENLDRRPVDALASLGAPATSSYLYGTLPLSATRFVSFALYRWEVAARETVVVGVVGAGGLGRLLEQQRAAFDMGGMVATVLALIAVSALVDVISTTSRRVVG